MANHIDNFDEQRRFDQLRENMVEWQLYDRGIFDPRVLDAMRTVPREEFVPDFLRHEAYEDGPLPIGHGQTISQPFTVAYMVQALELTGDEDALEIGTGSGYGAAVLSRLVRSVHTIERIPALAQKAQLRLRDLGYDNVIVHIANGTLGLPDHSSFDAIVVTAGAAELPQPYAKQLADGGRIVIPLGETITNQRLARFTKHGDQLQEENLGRFAFVPLIGKHGWHEIKN